MLSDPRESSPVPEAAPPAESVPDSGSAPAPSAGQTWRQRLRRLPSWQRWGLGGGAALAIALITYAGLSFSQQLSKETGQCGDEVACPTASPSQANETAVPESQPTATPVKVAALLDGSSVDAGTENLHPLAVVIENHPDARPQYGLGQANLVYEAIAEGGITRFLAVFANPTVAVKVGPVRSARTFFVDWATELNAFLAHVGGNIDALDQIKATGVLDLDQFAVGNNAYAREPRGGVALEHTMFSSTEKLWRYATETRRWSKEGAFSAWKFADDPAEETLPTSQSVSVNVSERQYAVTWSYDRASNSYARSMAGTAHVDAGTKQQIKVKNVIIHQVNRTPVITRINENGWKFNLTGSGIATVIKNGTATKATWKKEGTGRTLYYDETGQEIVFTRGPIWVNITHPDSSVSY